jgi:hypothetical protein
MAADGSSVPPCAPQSNTPQHHPNDLEWALARLIDLHEPSHARSPDAPLRSFPVGG